MPGSQLPRPARAVSACTSFSATPDAGEVLVRVRAVAALRIDDGQRRRQFLVRFVVVGDDEIDAQFPGAAGGVGAANPAVDRHDDARRPSACSRSMAGVFRP